tara:strand:- start:206 stop:610 length:405 start_codon:yes stop_codon:yes gene_type:complete
MTPEMLKFINSSKLESVPTFEEYFEKRYLEECKYLVENPKFSISHMIFASKLRENVRRMALEEYKKKYPLSQIILKSKSESNLVSISEETISNCGDGFEEITMNELGDEPSSEPSEPTPTRPRRSARLNKKSTN